jgi:FecR-like protein
MTDLDRDPELGELSRRLPAYEPSPDESAALRRGVLFAVGRVRRRRLLAWRMMAIAACAVAGVMAAALIEGSRHRPRTEPAVSTLEPRITRIVQEGGRTTYDVAPRGPGERFVVSTPDADVEVRGTRFTVSVDPSGTAVDVAHGRVEVRDRAGALRHVLQRGEHARVERAAPVALSAPVLPPPTPEPPRLRHDHDGRPRPEAPPPAGEPPDAELRLFRVAHELHFGQGDFAAALDAWNRYLATYPQGTLAQEARYNRAVCLLRLGRSEEAEPDLSSLAAMPDAFRSREARLLRAAALLREGRCSEVEELLAPLRSGGDEIARRAAALPPCAPRRPTP